jgi:hypothetical protein
LLSIEAPADLPCPVVPDGDYNIFEALFFMAGAGPAGKPVVVCNGPRPAGDKLCGNCMFSGRITALPAADTATSSELSVYRRTVDDMFKAEPPADLLGDPAFFDQIKAYDDAHRFGFTYRKADLRAR